MALLAFAAARLLLCCQSLSAVKWKDRIAGESRGGRIWVGCRDLNVVAVSRQARLLIDVWRKAGGGGNRGGEADQSGSRAVG